MIKNQFHIVDTKMTFQLSRVFLCMCLILMSANLQRKIRNYSEHHCSCVIMHGAGTTEDQEPCLICFTPFSCF